MKFIVLSLIFTAVIVLLIHRSATAQSAATVTVTFLYTNDLHGVIRGSDESSALKLKPGQGLLRISTVIRNVRKENPNTIVMDGGDLLHGTPMMYVNHGEPMTELLNAAGYDIITLGNHDFEWKCAATVEHIKRGKQEVVVSNAVFPPEYDFSDVKPYALREVGGVRIAIAGLLTEDTYKFIWPGYIQGLKIESPEKAMNDMNPELRKNADYVVLLSHLGTMMDLQLASVSDIDLILGGHSHDVVYPPIRINKTSIINTGSHGSYLGRVDVDFAPIEAGGMKPVDMRSSLIPIDDNIDEDADLLPIYEKYKEAIDHVLSRKVADSWFVKEPCGVSEAKPDAGDRIADLLRDATGADIAVISAGLINGKMKEGPVFVYDFYSLMPAYSRQNIVLEKMSGARINGLIERSVNGGKRTRSLFFSGLTFDVSNDVADAKRLGKVSVNGKPLDAGGSYLVASTGSFLMDWTDMLSDDYAGNVDTSETLRDIVMRQLAIENTDVSSMNVIKTTGEQLVDN
jgi:2',3'-cyclic-nucleotide 2'-phosphodiesterase (5'-nucleotidase family)